MGTGAGGVGAGEGDPARGARGGAGQGEGTTGKVRDAQLAEGCPAPLTPVLRPQVALAVALDLRTFLRLRPGAEGRLSVSLPGVGVRRSWDTPELRALRGRIAGKGRGEEPLPRGSEGLPVLFGDRAGTPLVR